jgi:hypothetical protein
MTMEISVDTTSGTVALDINGTYTAEQLLQLLYKLSEARKQVAQDPSSPVGQQVFVVPGANWFTEPLGTDTSSSLLTFLMPGFGWLGITLSNADRCRLAHYLTGQAVNTLAPPAAADTAAGAAAVQAQDNGRGGGGTLH